MKALGVIGLAASVAMAAFFPSCSKNSSASDGDMFVQTCSLGCSSGASGFQISCAIVNTYVNKDVTILFSLPVDAGSLDTGTFQLIDVNSGQVPVGSRFVDPTDPHKIVFRPSVNFDLQGNPTFGLTANTTYRIICPGTAQNDPGPFIRSTDGKPNKTRMQCDILTTLGIVDYVPGQPNVAVFVDTIDPNTGVVTQNVPAQGAMNVWQSSTIRFVFDDVMNPTTLANAMTHQSPFITIKVDVDGNPGTTDDQVTLFGNYTVAIDVDNLKTTMTFQAPNGLPSAGNPMTHPMPRKLVITVPSNVQDLAGNGVANPGIFVCTPQVSSLPPVTIPNEGGETFADQTRLDASHSCADWGPPPSPDPLIMGRLTRGFGGASGRLEELHVAFQQTVTMNTDSQVFPLAGAPAGEVMTNKDPMTDYDPGDSTMWPKVTVNDGILEFSKLTIDSGGTLKITGTKPARVYSRGPMVIDGTLSVSAPVITVLHQSDSALGDIGGLGGPGAGDGGKGGDRVDNSASTGTNGLLGTNAMPNPGGMPPDGCGISNPGAVTSGAPGLGVGRVAGLGSGGGGAQFSPIFITTSNYTGALGHTTLTEDDSSTGGGNCFCYQAGAPGGGGTYSLSGTTGVATTVIPLDILMNSNLPPPTPFGPSIGLEPPTSPPVIRKLDADFGNLRGGAGGGGGGTSLLLTTMSPVVGDCSMGNLVGANAGLYFDNSACGGGGGGGALQIVSGGQVTLAVNGLVIAKGGDGGSSFVGTSMDPAREKSAAPGGGGSGGAVRVQGNPLFFDTTGTNTVHINITGGVGGTNAVFGHGGNGGPGLVRLETKTGTLVATDIAPHILPFNMTEPDSIDFLSIGTWGSPRNRPETYTAAVSCWMQPVLPEGEQFFSLDFIADDLAANPQQLGWNMDVIYDAGSGEHLYKYREPGPHSDPTYPFPAGQDFESVIGNKLNQGLPAHQGSYFCVRFQGALSAGTVADPCSVVLSGPGAGVIAGSVTPWVKQPAQLNEFNPAPNMIRFSVVFDKFLVSAGSIPSFIKGVTNLKIKAQPD
jgi:hypothetical protein